MIAGGFIVTVPVVTNSAELYNPFSGNFSRIASMTEQRLQHTATLLPNGQVLVVGGYDGDTDLSSAVLYVPSASTARTGGLVAYWPGEGNANDIVGGNHGTLLNGATFAAGEIGQAFSFDGVDDFVAVSDSANLDNITGALTIDVWIKPADTNRMGIVEKTVGGGVNTQLLLFLEGDAVHFRLIKDPGVDHRTIRSDLSPPVIPINDWTHVAATWDGASMKLYVNGVQQLQTLAVTGSINSGVGPTFIGKSGSNINHYDGLIDEVRLYNRALSASEIKANFDASGPAAAQGRIAFSSFRDGNTEIYVVNADGSGQTNLTNHGADDRGPAWSPDGAKIAFWSDRAGNTEIYVMNADGSGQTNLTNNPAFDSDPAWSPDGAKIAFASVRDGNWEIHVMNADGSDQTNLTNNTASDSDPAWSPDGAKIAFSSERDGSGEIYVMNADGSGQTNLTNNPAFDASPAWSPGGAKIAFHSYRDGKYEIYVMNVDGSGQTRITNNGATDIFPAWSPDGARIAFHSYRDFKYEIYVMNADGSGQTRLTNNDGDDLTPAWSPE